MSSPDSKGGYFEQLKNAERTAKEIAKIAKEGWRIVITHGNGPQVGNILLQQEYSKEHVASMPLSVCGAQSQGQIGTLLVNALNSEFKKQGLKTRAVAVVSHVLIDSRDPAFSNPSKPIGPIYTPQEARELKKQGMVLKKIMINAFRRMAPSPLPLKVMEFNAIKNLLDAGLTPVAVGGGGIPVVLKQRKMKLVDAVIDKDLASQVLASQLKADDLIVLTNVEKVALNFQKPNQKWLSRLTLNEARKYLKKGEFAPGSMGPKIEAAVKFLEKGGHRVIIAHLKKLSLALRDKSGTMITST